MHKSDDAARCIENEILMHLLDEQEAEIIQRLKQNEISIFSRVRSREDTDFFNKWSSIFSKYLSHKQF